MTGFRDLSGLNLDFELSSANCTDLEMGFELLGEHTDLEVLVTEVISVRPKLPHCGTRTAFICEPSPARTKRSKFRRPSNICIMPSVNGSKSSTLNCLGNSPLIRTMPIPFGACVLVCTVSDHAHIVHLYQSLTRKTGLPANHSPGFSELA
jgi:hypothetical protein